MRTKHLTLKSPMTPGESAFVAVAMVLLTALTLAFGGLFDLPPNVERVIYVDLQPSPATGLRAG
jgi:hypothetical protein